MMERKTLSLWRVVIRHDLWVALIPALVALVLGGVGLGLWNSAREMARDGGDAVAQVTDRRIRTTTDRDGNRRTRHIVGFTFAPRPNQTVESHQAVSRD